MNDLLLDTTALSAAMGGDVALDSYLAGLDASCSLYTSVIAEGEIRFGLARLSEGRRKRLLTEALDAVLGSLHDVLAATRDVAATYADVKATLWERGTPIDENDIWIASTGRQHGLAVLTSDVDFRRVPELKVETWSTA